MAIARAVLRLPYMSARMHRHRDGDHHVYDSERRRDGSPFHARWHVAGPARAAAPGTLDHFLVERYELVWSIAGRSLCHIDVEHAPWLLRTIDDVMIAHGIDRGDGLPPLGPPVRLHYSEGVDVRFVSMHLM